MEKTDMELTTGTGGTGDATLTNGEATIRTQKRPPPETSPRSDLQADQKKIHREDSITSTASSSMVDEKEDKNGCERIGIEVNSKTGDTQGAENAVRQKFYADLLTRSMASNLPVHDTDTFGVEDPSDSLLLKLLNLVEKTNVSQETDSGLQQKNKLILTPLIRNLFSPESSRNAMGKDKDKQDNTADCVLENNLYLKAMSKAIDNM